MKKILGIDLGTNSLGWALIEQDTSLIDGGVVIFPRGNNQDPISFKESSFAQMRTIYRGARRRLYRRKLRRIKLMNIAKDLFNLTESDIFTNSDPVELYKLRSEGLSRILNPSELFRICLYFAKKRGFLSNRKDLMKEANKESGEVKKGIAHLEQQILEEGCKTLGEFYYKLISAHQNGNRLEERILARWTSRKMYQDELNMIMTTQLKLNSPYINSEISEEIKKEIFFQRPLKSAKHLIGKCRFESNKRCTPRCHPLFQEFRVWQSVSNLRWTNPDTGETSELNHEEKSKIVEYLKSELKPNLAKIKKMLGLSTRTFFNDIELKSCKTKIQIDEILNRHNINTDENMYNDIFHALLFTQDGYEQKMKSSFLTRFNISSQATDELLKVILEPDYSNISLKAIKKILPFLKKGFRYDQACIEAGYHHSFEIKFKNYDKVPLLKTNELRNPVVQKSVSVCISLVNKIIEVYGKPDEVRIELARELKKPKRERELIRLNNFKKTEKRERYRAILEEKFGRTIAHSESILLKYELWLELGCADKDFNEFTSFVKDVKKSDLEKYNLWLEADRISPYTGKTISLSQLLNSDIEIEHIIPFSRSLDNSYMNKTLCESSFNRNNKGKQTPMEYFLSRPIEELETFKKRISSFSNPIKKDIFLLDKLPDNFLNSQLSDTAYIAKLAIQKIGQCIEKVYASKGGVTSQLRKNFGLNNILHYGDDQNLTNEMKNRGDHRHHFIDAVVIATSTTSIIQKLSKSAARSDGKIEMEIPMPWPRYRSDIEEKVNSILVVHKFNKKLLKSSKNNYKHDINKNKLQIQKAIRGSMHEDSLYGQILNPNTQEYNFVISKPINSLNEKQIEKIVDPKIREFLHAEINKHGSWSQVIKNPLIFNGKPLRKVRWINNSKSLELLRNQTQTFVETGNNFVLAIYEGEDGKRDYESIPFYKAVKNKLQGHLIFPKSKNNKELLYTIKNYDKFILYSSNQEEINWENLEELNKRLYHNIKFTKNRIYLGWSNLSKIQADKDKMPIRLDCTSNNLTAIKICLNILGKISWKSTN